MAHNVESLMWTGTEADAPWHGLGIPMGDRIVKSEEALKVSGLNWEVSLSTIYASLGQNVPIAGYKAVVRSVDNKALGVVGDRYRPVQNKEAFAFLDALVDEGANIHTCGSLCGGSRVWILAKLPGVLVVNGKDVTEKYILFSNSHDGTSTVKAFFTGVRVVCQNTERMALRGFDAKDGFSIRHTQSLDDKLDQARKVLGLANDYFQAFEQKIQTLANTRFSQDQMVSVVKGLFPAKDESDVHGRTQGNRDQLMNLFENGRGIDGTNRGTAYAAMNAVSEFVDHYRGTRETDSSGPENRLNAIWFGAGQAMKTKGNDLIDAAILNGTQLATVNVPQAMA